MKFIYPEKLRSGDEVRAVAAARSRALIGRESRQIAAERFEALGLKLTFGEHVDEQDMFGSSSVKSRVEDLHAAFSDKNVKAVLTVIGGYNSNQLLDYIDWSVIKNNPKIFCGFSDITALCNAIYAQTGLVTYYGPHYSTFGQKLHFNYTLEYFKKCLLSGAPFEVLPSKDWSDDLWFMNQNERQLITNPGWQVLNEGEAKGTLLGGHLGTFGLLFGTAYMPEFSQPTILLAEEDSSSGKLTDVEFDRRLQALIQQPGFNKVKGLLIGRFQKASEMTAEKLQKIIKTKAALAKMPVVAGLDFGHTDPKVTLPIGGQAALVAKVGQAMLIIERH